MHLGRRYKLSEYALWMQRETALLFIWALFVTTLFEVTQWQFLAVPGPLLAVVGTAVAIVLGFKNGQCYARTTEALALWGQISSASAILANKSAVALGKLEPAQSAPLLRDIFYRHFAWLTAMRFFLRTPKTWENLHEPGNKKFLEALPTPESQSSLQKELAAYFPEDEVKRIVDYRGDREGLLLQGQYRSVGRLYQDKIIDEAQYYGLTAALDDLVRLQGASKRIKTYPYARNYYSISVILVVGFVAMLPLGMFQYTRDIGKPTGLEHWTVWLNVLFSVIGGWIFVTLEKVGENSSNPFEGGPNDVPISFLSRRIEIEMRTMLGENTELKPIEPKYNILF